LWRRAKVEKTKEDRLSLTNSEILERDAGSSYAFNAYLYGIAGHFLKFFDLLYCFCEVSKNHKLKRKSAMPTT